MAEVDARELGRPTTIRADVCIVGGGPAGLTLAMELTGSGAKVVLLEAGGRSPDRQVQDQYRGDVVGLDYFPLDVTRLRFLGGTTNHWEGYTWPLDEGDFTFSPEPFGGWPIAEQEVARYYPRVHELIELGEVDYDPVGWSDRLGFRLLPIAGDSVRHAVLRRSPPTRFGPQYGDVVAGDPDTTLCLYAEVLELLADADGARGVRFTTLDGDAIHTVEAPTVVLATGAIENARTLLLSRDGQGRVLANSSGLVGRCFIEHPHILAGLVVVDESADLGAYVEDVPVDEGFTRIILNVNPEARRTHGIGNVAGVLHRARPMDEDRLRARTGREAVERLRGVGHITPSRVYQLQLMAEQVPAPESRIVVSPHHDDDLGRPIAQLDWRLRPEDHRTMAVATELFGAGLGASGVARLHSFLHEPRPSARPYGGNHQMGTTRMSEDPTRGVVDPDGQAHDVPGLYIAGSSVYPTGGCANPTLTLLSLTLRMAEHLRKAGR